LSQRSAHARLRDRLREETARTILASAEEVFAEDGLHAARMERIASRAGVAVGTLYNHFKDRDALLDALTCARREAFLARLDDALAATEGKPVADRVRAFLGAVAEHARAHGPFLRVLVQAGEGPASPRPSGTILNELVARADAVVARGIAEGELRPDPAGVFGLALVGALRAVLSRSIERGSDPDALSDAVLELFLRGAAR
jgi:AcrR family transcriptional regulator